MDDRMTYAPRAEAATRTSTATLLSQVMFLVAVAIGFTPGVAIHAAHGTPGLASRP